MDQGIQFLMNLVVIAVCLMTFGRVLQKESVLPIMEINSKKKKADKSNIPLFCTTSYPLAPRFIQ